ncbi:LysE/ArgO family amino acid transporter [Simplicispira suum]|uniref:Lysine transporter LysE n=1 Tax=Simplicispira suum TaxID=2109915 RepID=A0A2S0N4R7_9BURK|nr:LysE family transporter [Simplicispira suum]AVO42933.1 lysine transporter LysE [Simplicispira suum]
MWMLDAASSWLAGFTICFALVASIGAQNLFVLRQAVTGRHVSVCVAWCVLSDALLVGIGVAGMAQLLENMPVLAQALSLGGAVFLLCYGLLAWSRLLSQRGAAVAKEVVANPPSRRAVLGALAAITLLNPHVYLDTVVLMGSMGARQPGAFQAAFVAGAASASLAWFLCLALAGRRLQAVFARPQAWRALDALTGAMMLVLAWWVWSGAQTA